MNAWSTVSRDTWQRALLRPCKGLTRDSRLTLLACSTFMRKDGRLSKTEHALAEASEVSDRQFRRHREAAVDCGWLVRESAGKPGATAVYWAAMPVVSDRHMAVISVRRSANNAGHCFTGIIPIMPDIHDRPVFKPLRTHSRGRLTATRCSASFGKTKLRSEEQHNPAAARSVVAGSAFGVDRELAPSVSGSAR